MVKPHRLNSHINHTYHLDNTNNPCMSALNSAIVKVIMTSKAALDRKRSALIQGKNLGNQESSGMNRRPNTQSEIAQMCTITN